MKKTLSINLGGFPFIIDEDAYGTLNNYLSEIEIRLDRTDDKEILEDIESRIADILKESILQPDRQVVTLPLVKRAISIIGSASEFGEPKRTMNRENAECNNDRRKLYRSRTDKIIGGVCGGVAEYFCIDPTVVRLITFFLVFLGGLSLWVYIIMWIAVPLAPRDSNLDNHNSKRYKE